MIHTLARSGMHRMILMAYGGLAFAIVLSGTAGMGTFVGHERVAAAGFLFFHIVAMVALLLATRHLFSLPAELKANWVFQLTERDARGEWLYAVDRLVLFWAALPWLAPLPLEIHWMGWRGLAEAALTAVLGLLLYDWLFASWNKLPFTCSYLPGKTPGWMLALRFLGVAATLPFFEGLLFLVLYSPLALMVILPVAAVVWRRVHAARRDGWPELRLKYEEAPDPVIHGLHLLR